MSRQKKLKRKTFFVNESALRRARKALRLSSDSETIRVSLDRVAEMEEFWRFMDNSRMKLKSGSIEES